MEPVVELLVDEAELEVSASDDEVVQGQGSFSLLLVGK